MKKRAIGILALSAMMIAALASCNRRISLEDSDKEYPAVKNDAADSEYGEYLSSCTIDTSGAKTIFYTGEEFSAEGLKVTLNYFKTDKNGTILRDQDMIHHETDMYSVNSKEVNLSKPGKYPVTVTVREGTFSEEKIYEITVKSSLLESTPNIEYISGIDMTFTDNTTIKEYLLDDTINLSASSVKFSVHKEKHGALGDNGEFEVTDTILTQAEVGNKVQIDVSRIKNNEVGTYMITATYDNGMIDVAGVSYHNTVTSYVLVNVSNPIEKIEYVSGTEEFEATVEGIDISDWKIKVSRKRRAAEIIDFDEKLFKVEGVDNFKWNNPQTITIRSVENPAKYFNHSIGISESSIMDIERYVDLKPNGASEMTEKKVYTLTDATKETDGSYKVGGVDFIISYGSQYEDRSDKGSNMTSDKKYYTDSDGALKFQTRVTAKGDGQPIKVTMDKPGKIVVYFSSTNADEERELVMRNEAGEELETANTIAAKQAVTKHIFTVTAAGTYSFIASSALYFHGIVIAKNK